MAGESYAVVDVEQSVSPDLRPRTQPPIIIAIANCILQVATKGRPTACSRSEDARHRINPPADVAARCGIDGFPRLSLVCKRALFHHGNRQLATFSSRCSRLLPTHTELLNSPTDPPLPHHARRGLELPLPLLQHAEPEQSRLCSFDTPKGPRERWPAHPLAHLLLGRNGR
jgi:hypothetical protein